MKKFFDQPLSENLIVSLRDRGQPLVRYDLNDHRRELVKSAASRLFPRERIEELRPPDTHFGVHHIIMGSEEAYGDNRNHDAFPHKTLESSHPTFVKFGHVYREHRHKKDDTKLGLIKASAYCPVQQQVELYIWACKSAAAKEYEEAKQGKQHAFSMSAAMPWDECSICLNHAKKPEEYCDDLAHNLGGWDSARKKYAYARNPIARFFDDSFVSLGADRTAFTIEASLHRVKSASGRVISAAEIAAVINAEIPDYDEEQYVKMANIVSRSDMRERLIKMAAAEKRVEDGWHKQSGDAIVEHGLAYAFSGAEFPEELIRKMSSMQPATAMHHMAKRAMFMPFKTFISWASGRSFADLDSDPVIKEASACLPTMLREMADAMESGSLDTEVSHDMPKVMTACGEVEADIDSECTDEVQKLMDHASEKLSCKYGDMQRRAQESIVKSAAVKAPIVERAAHVSDTALFYSRIYGLYKLAAVRDVEKYAPKINNIDLLAVSAHYPFFIR